MSLHRARITMIGSREHVAGGMMPAAVVAGKHRSKPVGTAAINKLRRLAVEADPVRRCRKCGCTDQDCRGCIERTGEPCHWVAEDLCSACV